MTHSRPTRSYPCRSLWAASWVPPAGHPGPQHQTNGVLNSWVSCVLQSTRSDGLYFFSSIQTLRGGSIFPDSCLGILLRKLRWPMISPLTFFLLSSWKVGLTHTVGRTLLMMLRVSLKGGCQRRLIWRASPGAKGQFKLFLKKHK